MGKIFDSEEIFNLMQEMLTEVECLKHIMTGGATAISEKASKKLEKEPVSDEAKEAIDEFIKRTNKYYGTMEDKEWIKEKCNTNTPPTFVPEHPSKGNIKSKTTDNSIRTKEEVEDKLKQLTIAFNYAVLDRDKIQGWIEALEWMMKKHEN